MSTAPDLADTALLLARPLVKTEAGHREIAERSLALSRSARNLLLIIDGGRKAGDWLALVRGCGPAELQQLLTAGLVGPAPPAAPSRTSAAAVAAAVAAATAVPGATVRMSLGEALQQQGYQLLYDRLTAEARPLLGLFKGYKLILEIERCSGPEEMRVLALKVVEQVRGLQGDGPARALAQRLADPAD